jgi:hypothetical protein
VALNVCRLGGAPAIERLVSQPPTPEPEARTRVTELLKTVLQEYVEEASKMLGMAPPAAAEYDRANSSYAPQR